MYQKFKKHCQERGFSFAIKKSVSHLLRTFPHRRIRIQGGDTVLVLSRSGIAVFWQGHRITAGAGFNININIRDSWMDCSGASWHVIEKGFNTITARLNFKNPALCYICVLTVKNDSSLEWFVNMETASELDIKELQVIFMARPFYKAWVSGCQQGDFPRLGRTWHDIYRGFLPVPFVGMRFSLRDGLPPGFFLECSEHKQFFPLIQKTPLFLSAYNIGFYRAYPQGISCFSRRIFTGVLRFLNQEQQFDKRVEELRRSYIEDAGQKLLDRPGKKKIKVLLVNLPWEIGGKWGVRAGSRWPHIKDESEGAYAPFPFFLAYATALLRKYDIEADLIDALLVRMPADQLIEEICRRDYDFVVAETSVPSFYYDMVLLEKLSRCGISLILCGPHPDIYRKEFIEKNSFVQFVLCREYEFTLLELIQAVSRGARDFSGIDGLIWKDSAGVHANRPRVSGDINSLPYPWRQGLAMEKYQDLPGDIPHPSVQMVASRGCTFSCNFCLWPQIMFSPGNYRVRNIDDCVREMEFLVRDKRFKSIYFDDDTFNIGRDRMFAFCDAVLRRGLQHIPWAVMAKADLMDEEVLDRMRQAGLAAIKYGVESSSQHLVNHCGKRLDLNKTERIIRHTKSLGIKVHLTFAFGLDGETKETIKKTIEYALRLNPYSAQFSIITPFPGTALFAQLEKDNRIITRNWSLYDGHACCVFKPKRVSALDLQQAKEYACRRWAEHTRRRRGLGGDIKRFFSCWHQQGCRKAFCRAKDYVTYLIFHRKKFLKRI